MRSNNSMKTRPLPKSLTPALIGYLKTSLMIKRNSSVFSLSSSLPSWKKNGSAVRQSTAIRIEYFLLSMLIDFPSIPKMPPHLGESSLAISIGLLAFIPKSLTQQRTVGAVTFICLATQR